MGRLILRAAAILLACNGPGGLAAQEAGIAPGDADGVLAQVQAQAQAPAPGEPAAAGPSLPIVVLNQERLLSRTLYGQRIQREIEAAGAALAAENRQIEADLTAEELRLTERRGTMTAEDFAPLAAEFDARVESIRAAQEAKSRALQAQAEAAQAQFFETAYPLLIDLVRAREAAVLMDSRAVLLSVEGADITDAAIAFIDSRIGEGPEGSVIDLDGTGGEPRPRPVPPPEARP